MKYYSDAELGYLWRTFIDGQRMLDDLPRAEIEYLPIQEQVVVFRQWLGFIAARKEWYGDATDRDVIEEYRRQEAAQHDKDEAADETRADHDDRGTETID